jgi:membrane-associated phospholipid phosphatase
MTASEIDERTLNRRARKIRRNMLISGFVFIGAFVLASIPEAFDRPVTRLVNRFADHSPLFDYMVSAFSEYATFSGVLLVALIWYCWFDDDNSENRVRILVGTIASFGAGVISRFLQHTLTTHPRPYYDPALDFHRPNGMDLPFNTWDSFPSDHVAVFAGLAVVLYVARPRLAVYAIIWTMIVESLRTYTGSHYPSDLIAGAALAAFVVWAAQASWPASLGERMLRLERSSPALFYMTAFFLSYQIATLFWDIRGTFGPLRSKIMFLEPSPSSRFVLTSRETSP